MAKIKRRLCILMTVFLFSICIGNIQVHAEDSEAEGRVLFISSYSYASDLVQMQIEGLITGFEGRVVLDYEFMDTKRVDDEISEQQFYEGLSYRMSQVEPYDVIILGDDAALLFAVKHQEELFDGIPLVYEGVNDEELAVKVSEDPLITGIIEKYSINDNIDFGRTLYPDARKVVAILDDSTTGRAARKAFFQCAEDYPELEFSEINSSSLSRHKLRQNINQVGTDSILIYILMTEDAGGRRYSTQEAVQFIADNARVPVIHMVEGGIEEGLLGGKVISMTKSGEIVARIAMEIIEGKEISNIEMLTESPNIYCVNELVMKQYGLDLSLIPEGAVIINHQPSFWERNSEVILPGCILIVAFLIIIVWVTHDNFRRRKILVELEEARNIMESASQHDFLTGLPNRSKFMEDLENFVGAGTPCTVMMLDIDNFKHINDSYGHTTGDEALKELADRLKGMKTPLLTPYRYAGDEFIIILKSCQRKIVEREALHCHQLFEKQFYLAGEKKKVGGSIGVASYPSDAGDVEQLINCADDAMYQVKKGGKNNFAFYTAVHSS